MLYSIPIRAILGERRIELENTITNSIDFNGFSRQAHTNCVVPKPIVNDPLYLITRPMYLNSSKFRNYTRQLIFKTYRLQQTAHPHTCTHPSIPVICLSIIITPRATHSRIPIPTARAHVCYMCTSGKVATLQKKTEGRSLLILYNPRCHTFTRVEKDERETENDLGDEKYSTVARKKKNVVYGLTRQPSPAKRACASV